MGFLKKQKGRTESGGLRAITLQFYSDCSAGTRGKVVKFWDSFQGPWYKLYLGRNLSGKKLYKSFPANVLFVYISDMKHVFEFIKADQFFPKYCPEIKSYKHKIRGKNGRGNPLDFSEDEKKQIKTGLKKLFKDL